MKGMMRGLLLAVLAFGAAPATAGPRVTLHLERASLHEVLMHLNQTTGLRLTGPGGSGRASYKDPPGAKRTRIEYRDAPIGRVLREIAAVHDLIPQAAGGYVGFVPRGNVSLPREVPGGKDSRIALSFHRLSQSEYREIVPGAGPVAEDRSLDLRLCLRALEGDGDVFGEVRKLRLTDDQGQVREIPAETYSQELGRGLPDERFLDLSVPWKGATPARLRRLEGVLEVAGGVTERKVTLAVPSGGAPVMAPTGIESQVGPFRVKLMRWATQNTVSARVRIEWAAGQSLVFNDQGLVRAAVVLADGQSIPMAGQARRGKGDPSFALGDFYAPAAGQPVALEVMVPARNNIVREEAFAISDITLPFGLPYPLRTHPVHEPLRPLTFIRYRPPSPVPPAFQQSGGGTASLRLPGAALGSGVELTLGIQRSGNGGTWGPPHWISVEAPIESIALDNLSEGSYRFTLRCTFRAVDDAPIAPQVWRSAPVSVRKGRRTDVVFPPSGSRN